MFMICLIAQPCNSDFFCLGKKCRREKNFSQFAYGNLRPQKKTPSQNRLFTIFVGKMVIYVGKIVTCLGKIIFLYYYFLLPYNKDHQQIQLIAQCLYFLIRKNTCCPFAIHMIPVMSVIFRRNLQEKNSPPRSSKILEIEHSEAARTYFM